MLLNRLVTSDDESSLPALLSDDKWWQFIRLLQQGLENRILTLWLQRWMCLYMSFYLCLYK